MERVLNLYRVTLSKEIDYLSLDHYSEYICSAYSEKSARLMHPGGGDWIRYDHEWVNEEDVDLLNVVHIGVATANVKGPGIITVK